MGEIVENCFPGTRFCEGNGFSFSFSFSSGFVFDFRFYVLRFFSVFCFSSSRRVKVEQLTGLNVGLVGVRASAGPTVGPKFA